MADKNVQIW